MARRPGRPRASGDPHGERDTRQDVLDAAAALFCTVGFTSTSTRAIADAAGVRQASIYHHFAGKDAILLELLLGTVRPSLELADALAAGTEPAAARLWALAHADVGLLSAGPVNLGVLYVLPEVAGEQFAEFHALRSRLRARYSELAAAAAPDGADVADRGAARARAGRVGDPAPSGHPGPRRRRRAGRGGRRGAAAGRLHADRDRAGPRPAGRSERSEPSGPPARSRPPSRVRASRECCSRRFNTSVSCVQRIRHRPGGQ